MVQNLAAFAWGPGFIGYAISLALYGVTVAQSTFYFYTFPNDPGVFKCFVAMLFLSDTLDTMFITIALNTILIRGRPDPSALMDVPWGLQVGIIYTALIASTAHSFYAIRLWRISEKNRVLVYTIVFCALVQLGAGMAFGIFTTINKRETDIYTSEMAIDIQLISTIICDTLITTSLVYYIRSKRTGVARTETVLQSLVIYTVNFGLIGCVMALLAFILIQAGHPNFRSVAPHFVIGKSYVNSILASLNVRKSFRERFHFEDPIALPTISTDRGYLPHILRDARPFDR